MVDLDCTPSRLLRRRAGIAVRRVHGMPSQQHFNAAVEWPVTVVPACRGGLCVRILHSSADVSSAIVWSRKALGADRHCVCKPAHLAAHTAPPSLPPTSAGDAAPAAGGEPPRPMHSDPAQRDAGAILRGPQAQPPAQLVPPTHVPAVDDQDHADVTADVSFSAHGSVEQLLQCQDDVVCEQLTR